MSFAALLLLWPEPRLRGAEAGRPLPRLQRVVDDRVFRAVCRAVVLLVAVGVLYVALAGPPETRFNLAPYVLYVTFWVGLIPLSILLGPVWRVVNPLRTAHTALCRVGGIDPDADNEAVLRRVGMWPAAASLLVFVWLELVYPERADPRTVGVFLTAYATVQLMAAVLLGRGWFRRGDGFEVYAELLARLSPLGRRSDGRLVLRNPLDGIDAVRGERGLVAVVAVLIGSTAFDGLTRTSLWTDNVDPRSIPAGSAGLLGMVLAAALLFWLGARGGALLDRGEDRLPGRDLPALFVASLVPIAAGYAVAHYFSLLLLEGQVPLALMSDPLRTGADWFGTATRPVNYTYISPDVISYVQVGAIVVGHVLGVITAHERSVRHFTSGSKTAAQYPLLAVMVLFTCAGVGLLLSS